MTDAERELSGKVLRAQGMVLELQGDYETLLAAVAALAARVRELEERQGGAETGRRGEGGFGNDGTSDKRYRCGVGVV